MLLERVSNDERAVFDDGENDGHVQGGDEWGR